VYPCRPGASPLPDTEAMTASTNPDPRKEVLSMTIEVVVVEEITATRIHLDPDATVGAA
jgi:hypothetical protein